MQIDNATKENIHEIQQKISELADTNPALEARTYPMEDQPTNAKIFEKLESIERLLKHIFDGHVLMDGQFKKISGL